MKTYYVVYKYEHSLGSGYASCMKRIEGNMSVAVINEIHDELTQKKKYTQVLILNWKEIEE